MKKSQKIVIFPYSHIVERPVYWTRNKKVLVTAKVDVKNVIKDYFKKWGYRVMEGLINCRISSSSFFPSLF